MPVGVSGSQRLPSTKGGPSWRGLETLSEEPGQTYTSPPEIPSCGRRGCTPEQSGPG